MSTCEKIGLCFSEKSFKLNLGRLFTPIDKNQEVGSGGGPGKSLETVIEQLLRFLSGVSARFAPAILSSGMFLQLSIQRNEVV